MSIFSIYYLIRPILPRRVQLFLHRQHANLKRASSADVWPIDQHASQSPPGWQGWPGDKEFALVLTHDVDTARGQERCQPLMQLEEDLGFRSSFNFVPERYQVLPELRHDLTKRGFEVGVHGLSHDGKLYKSHEHFLSRAQRINQYLREWKAVGFRSPAMHHNLDWIHELDIQYDASTFDTDPFQPQPDGVTTIYPFWKQGATNQKEYVELPYTLAQDFNLFVIMKEPTIDIWKKKLAWIADQGGMALINTHPDYMTFNGTKPGMEEYPADLYAEFLTHIRDRYTDRYWHALPKEMASFWPRDTANPAIASNEQG